MKGKKLVVLVLFSQNYYIFFNIFGEKHTLKVTKNCIFCLKGDFEPQYFTLRTI